MVTSKKDLLLEAAPRDDAQCLDKTCLPATPKPHTDVKEIRC
jgi:hypothetical protein